MTESTEATNAEARLILALPENVQQDAKDILCTELPIVIKHLTTMRNNLNKTLHPFKYMFLGWAINICELGQTELSCPVPEQAPSTPPATN